MYIHFLQPGFVDGNDQAAQGAADQFVDGVDAFDDLALGDRGRDVDIPGAHAGEVLVLREHAVQEGGAAAIIADDEERFFDGLFFVGGEEDVIQPEAEPGEEGHEGPNGVKE